MIHQLLSPDRVHPQISSSLRLLFLCLVRWTCSSYITVCCFFKQLISFIGSLDKFRTSVFNTDFPLTERQILASYELKEFADDNFKFDENGRKFKRTENIVGNGEIDSFEQLLFPQCFRKTCNADK